MATAYATFANGGHRIQPYIIERIYNFHNETIFQANPAQACASCFNKELSKVNTRLLDGFGHTKNDTSAQDTDDKTNNKDRKKEQDLPKNIDRIKEIITRLNASKKELEARQNDHHHKYPTLDAAPIFDRLNPKQAIQYGISEQAPRILSVRTTNHMSGMLKGVMTSGTGRKGNFRSDLGGKTGTTNQAKDVWFAGIQRHHVAVVWLGYDEPASLGSGAFGGTLAMPIWIDFMKYQLRDEPINWVDDANIAKSKKSEQRVISITDDNEAAAIEEMQDEAKKEHLAQEAEKALSDELLGEDIAESSGDEIIFENKNKPTGER